MCVQITLATYQQGLFFSSLNLLLLTETFLSVEVPDLNLFLIFAGYTPSDLHLF